MKLGIKMKLIDVLRFMSFDVNVIIYGEDDEEPLFKGGARDVPWVFVSCELYSNEDGAIFTCHETNEYGVIIPYVIICIIEE